MSLRKTTILAMALFAFISNAHADYISPADVVVQTKAYEPHRTDFPLGTYQYSVRWEGIEVANAAVSVSNRFLDSVNYYTVTARAVTGSFVKMFYRLRHESRSLFRMDDLSPIEFSSEQSENSRRRTRTVKFSSGGLVNAKLHDGKKKRPDEHLEFKSENPVFDPVSAAFLARSLPVNIGEELSFDVFNGKHRFLIGLTVSGRETITVNGAKYETFKVVPKVQKLTDTKGEQRLRSATIWVTADNRREVVRIRSEVFVGSVTAELVNFTPAPIIEPGMIRAALSTSLSDGDSAEEE